jgi:hypothetical protein
MNHHLFRMWQRDAMFAVLPDLLVLDVLCNSNKSTHCKPDDMAEEPEELRAVENCAGLRSARFVG